ncbi:hypothetical protein WJX72_002360 [[Myrmecia] bisecta]|uniref:TLDc domain-containing protein n=1 Tax=[Myrmecia] bisecta TaxID=41462 RepID=A0AAW1QQA4_9CHLO
MENLDLVETLFSRVFGKRALEAQSPFGMKRMTAEEFPEQYEATTTAKAAPVTGDSEEVALFRPLLAQTQLERVPLRLAYSADQHGWTAAAFHERVDTFGAAVVLARTEGGAICGGYNNRGWIGLGEDRNSIAAFLFTWPDGDASTQPIKLPKVGGASLAVLDKPDTGPWFGADSLAHFF